MIKHMFSNIFTEKRKKSIDIFVLKLKKIMPGLVKSMAAVMVAFFLYLIIGATVPYINQKPAGKAFKESFSVDDFYGDIGADWAAVIDDNGEALEERIRLIANAKESIILSTYDFRADTSGKQMIGTLMEAADRGVDVKILLDGVNYINVIEGNVYFQALAATENVEIKIYNPINLLLPWNIMSRMHDKYIVADEHVYILGGRNTFDYFLGDQEGYKNYDRDVLVVNTGKSDSSIYDVREYFEDIWSLKCCKSWDGDISAFDKANVKNAKKELEEITEDMKKQYPDWAEEEDYEDKTVPVDKITLISNPIHLGNKEAEAFYALSELMKDSDSEVIIHTPYIICSDYMYTGFKEICEDNMKVTLMTNSSANNGNAFGAVDYVRYKQEILDTGMEVLEYDGERSYHAKSILIDDDISIIGTFNMDMKSAYQNTEVMLVIQSKELNSQLRENMSAYHDDTKEAEVSEDKLAELITDDMSVKKKVLRRIIWVVDPVIRFLF